MSGSVREVQDLADQILALLWCETRCVHRPMPRLPVTHLSAAIVAGRESS